MMIYFYIARDWRGGVLIKLDVDVEVLVDFHIAGGQNYF